MANREKYQKLLKRRKGAVQEMREGAPDGATYEGADGSEGRRWIGRAGRAEAEGKKHGKTQRKKKKTWEPWKNMGNRHVFGDEDAMWCVEAEGNMDRDLLGMRMPYGVCVCVLDVYFWG